MPLFEFASKTDPNFSESHMKHDFNVFNTPYDHTWYSSAQTKKELGDIMVTEHSFSSQDGRKCNPFELYTVHYKAWMEEPLFHDQQRLVLDSHVGNNGKPIVF